MRSLTLPLPDGTSLTGWLDAPKKRSGTLFVLGHGAGGGMDAPLLESTARSLVAGGHSCLRFNFPYREAGKKAPDPAKKLEAAFVAVAEHARRLKGTERLVLGGKSMGGRMATHLAASGLACDGVLLLGYPLHRPGKPDVLRAEHLARITVPMLFLQGTRDALCDLPTLRRVLKKLPLATLHVVEGGDHSLAVLKSSGRGAAEVERELADVILGWAR